MNTSSNNEERLWAVLSHLSALALGMGILLPVIGWSEQRRKSKHASFQCLQALGYQSLGYTVWILLFILLFILSFSVFLFDTTGNNSRITAIWTEILIVVALGLLGIYILFPLIAAVSCAFGRDFRYPVMGHRLAKHLGYSPSGNSEWLIEDQEDRWVAAMGHFSVLIALWGILAPLTTWIVQGTRSPFVRFQAIQTSVYQALINILALIAGIVYLFGAAAFFAMTGFESDPIQTSSTSMLGLGIFGLSMCWASLILLIVPLFHILGQWAGYRVLKGDNYHYPVLGRLVERRMSDPTTIKSSSAAQPTGESL